MGKNHKQILSYGMLQLTKSVNLVAVLFLRSAVNKTGGFDTTLSQLADIDLWLRILQNHDAIFLDEALCKFRIHEKQQTQLNISSKRVEIDRFRLLLKAITHLPL